MLGRGSGSLCLTESLAIKRGVQLGQEHLVICNLVALANTNKSGMRFLDQFPAVT